MNTENSSSERTSTGGNADWGEGDTAAFLAFSKVFVPDREVQVDTVCSALPPFEEAGVVLELCCGEGLLARTILERYPCARVEALDGSDAMVQRARETLGSFAGRANVSGFRLEDVSWRGRYRNCRGVVSSLAVHHLDGAGKRTLFADVFSMLAPGGAFVLADLVLPTHPRGVEIAARAWDESVREQSLRESGTLQAFEAFQKTNWNNFREVVPDPVDKPSSIFDQLTWLRDAGFEKVDVFWMRAGHAVFGGYKGR